MKNHARIIVLLLALNAVGLCVMWRGPRPPAGPHPQLVILLAVDTLRADHLGCYGYSRATSPCIDQLAREGVVFENAFSQANFTRGSFASLLTGTYPERSSSGYRMSALTPTLASLLQSCGVRTVASTGGGGVNPIFGFGRGFDSYFVPDDFTTYFASMPTALQRVDEAARDGRPTFLFVHGYDVHLPYRKPLIFDRLFDQRSDPVAEEIESRADRSAMILEGDYFPQAGSRRVSEAAETYEREVVPHLTLGARNAPPVAFTITALIEARMMKERGFECVHLSEGTARHVAAAYDGGIRYADLRIGQLVDRIRALGLEDRTLLVLVGDHGEELLEAGMLGHGRALNDVELHVPLVVWAPGRVGPGRRVRQVVELTSVAPTVLDAFGIAAPSHFAAASCWPLLRGQVRDGGGGQAVSMTDNGLSGRLLSIRDERYRFVLSGEAKADPIRYFTQTRDGLYAADDTLAARNLIDSPERAADVDRLREALRQRVQ